MKPNFDDWELEGTRPPLRVRIFIHLLRVVVVLLLVGGIWLGAGHPGL